MSNPLSTGFLANLLRWFYSTPTPIAPLEGQQAIESSFVLTGPELIERVARSIELGQSIILEGPRGCGKSHCIRKGIELVAERGVIPPRASVFVQGNREIPRDYLAEDEIAFQIKKSAGGDSVHPYRRSAPLFKFATRDNPKRQPDKHEGTDHVICKMDDGSDCNRFVLFLDEINRFSDGVLDSLLSLLEERTAILGGNKYVLPVTVCMTMNPPGYDSSARKLSPPLAARIGRSYRLSTPDLDTMTDFIVAERWKDTREAYKASSEGRDAPTFPLDDPLLVRKAALVTLCLWGDVTLGERKAGLEYLTDGTRELLKDVMAADRNVADAMREVSKLCHYGPDGRAVADWIVSGTARAIEDASTARAPAGVLTPQNLIATVVDSVAHKIYDNFSPATRPDLTRKKEDAVRTVTRQVLLRRGLDHLLVRAVDNVQLVWERFGSSVLAGGKAPKGGIDIGGKRAVSSCKRLLQLQQAAVRAAFLDARVILDDDVASWSIAAREVGEGMPILEAICKVRRRADLEREFELWPGTESRAALHRQRDEDDFAQIPALLVAGDPDATLSTGSLAGFSSAKHDKLARLLAGARPLSKIFGKDLSTVLSDSLRADRFGAALAELVAQVGPVRRRLAEELAEFPIVRAIGIDAFLEDCGRDTPRSELLAYAREVEELANRRLGEELWDAQHAVPAPKRDEVIVHFLRDVGATAQEELLGMAPSAEPARVSRTLPILLRRAGEVLLKSGQSGTEDDADVLQAVAKCLN